MERTGAPLPTAGSGVPGVTKGVNLRLAKRSLLFNWHLANRGLTSLVKEALLVGRWLTGQVLSSKPLAELLLSKIYINI